MIKVRKLWVWHDETLIFYLSGIFMIYSSLFHATSVNIISMYIHYKIDVHYMEWEILNNIHKQ